jgi:hypothetical protein
MQLPPRKPFPAQANDTAFGKQWHQGGNTKLDGLLERKVHPLALRDAQSQLDPQYGGRLWIARQNLVQGHFRGIAARRDQGPSVISPVAVEQHDGVADLEPQHLRQMP